MLLKYIQKTNLLGNLFNYIYVIDISCLLSKTGSSIGSTAN